MFFPLKQERYFNEHENQLKGREFLAVWSEKLLCHFDAQITRVLV